MKGETMRSGLSRKLLGVAMASAAIIVAPTPADAAYDDSFSKCSDIFGCQARVRFVDYGEGKPGGGSNDDYLVCEDNSGTTKVGCWLWHNDEYMGGVQSAGDGDVVWEPYQHWNVKPGDTVGIQVCLWDQFDRWDNCGSRTGQSFDG